MRGGGVQDLKNRQSATAEDDFPGSALPWPRLRFSNRTAFLAAPRRAGVAPMTPWIRVDRADAPDGTRLELFRRGNDFSIRANGQLLMNTRVHGSEESLAELALSSLSERAKLSVLVGGLGCGYTLAATLSRVGPQASITVAEVEPAVVRWNRELLGTLNGRPLDDARVQVVEGDICALFRSPRQRFDAILLDVDNGPRAVARESNGWLYSPAGLAGIRLPARLGLAARRRQVGRVPYAGHPAYVWHVGRARITDGRRRGSAAGVFNHAAGAAGVLPHRRS